MPWKVTNMTEHRKNFILAAKNPQRIITFVELCAEYNISTKTGYKWLDRFEDKGDEGLKDLPRTPLTSPSKISTEVEQAVILIRNEFPKWGPKKILAEMQTSCSYLIMPSEGSIGNILSKHGLSHQRMYRRHVAQTAPLSHCVNSNDVWTYDFKGWFLTGNNAKCEPLTLNDASSRFSLLIKHMARKRSEDVWKALEPVFYEYGLPDRLRSDNGPPFGSLAVGRLSRLAIKLIKMGITPEWIKPGCPQENGRHERFHLTLKIETAIPAALTLTLQEEKFRKFREYYNNRRPHEAIGQVPPGSIYKPSTRTWDGKLRSPEYSSEYDVRKIGASGSITWKGTSFFISEVLDKENVGIKEDNAGLMGVHYGPILLGIIDFSRGFIRL
jgi:putative transposase